MKAKALTQEEIENKTVFLLDIMAETVFEEAFGLTDKLPFEKREEVTAGLVNRFVTVFNNNNNFKRKCLSRGNRGRDFAFCFLRHWTASVMVKDFGVQLNSISEFARGIKQ